MLGAQCPDAAVPMDGRGQDWSPLSAVLLSVRRPADRGRRDVGIPGLVERARGKRVFAVPCSRSRLVMRRSPGRRRRQLVGDPSGASAPAAADGFPRRNPARAPHDGRRADDALESRRPSRSCWKDSKFATWPTATHNLHFALLTDLRGRGAGGHAGDEELVRLAREGIEQLNQKYEQHRTDIFFSLPPSAALERTGRGVDGLRTQARQAGGVQRAAARRPGSVLPRSSATRPCCRKCATSSRSTPTRNCRAIRRGKWSGQWPTRSTGLCSMPSVAASSTATASCSRASA